MSRGPLSDSAVHYLEQLAEAQRRLRALEEVRTALVGVAYREGASWRVIGSYLGISGSAAHQVYATRLDRNGWSTDALGRAGSSPQLPRPAESMPAPG